jgi:hypothetical protein
MALRRLAPRRSLMLEQYGSLRLDPQAVHDSQTLWHLMLTDLQRRLHAGRHNEVQDA